MWPTIPRAARWVGGGLVAAAGLAVALALRSNARAPDPAPAPGPRALLVGVTKYDNHPRRNLGGPGNDVELFAGVLTEKFGVPAANIVRLTEAAGRADLRPTRANIEREFRQLAKVAAAGDQVVVLLAGHGSRQPQPDPPGRYPEPDRFDETFLPADANRWGNARDRVLGAIVDDEIGDWLRAITDKKAYVWVVFDCCHAESMDRNWNEVETARQIPPDELIPDAALAAARARAAGTTGGAEAPPARFAPREPSPYLAITYACRGFDTTPEGPQPPYSRDAPRHGLLTYTLCEALTQSTAPLTYKELAQRIQVLYTRRPRGSPTPTAGGGGQDREVLGLRQWPGRSDILLRKTDAGYGVTAGELHGLTRGTVLAVNGPAGTATAGDRLGHVRVTQLATAAARVEPVAFDGRPAAADLPDLATCKVAFTDYGVDRVRLFVDVPDGPARAAVLNAIQPLADPKAGLIELASGAGQAQWLLTVNPDTRRPVLQEGPVLNGAAYQRATRPPFALRPVGDPEFRAGLAESLERLYRARALLVVSARADAEAAHGPAAVRVEVEVMRHAGEKTPDAEPVRAADGALLLRQGEWVSFQVRNPGAGKVDVSLLIVGTDYAITPFFPLPGEKSTLDRGEVLTTPRGEVKPPFGPEQLVAIAVPSQNPPIDFGILAQPGLELRRGGDRSRALTTPLGQLLESAVYRVGGTRGVTRSVADQQMGVRVLSWRTEAGRAPGKR